MNTFCVNIISMETVKPSSPTPPHLITSLKLSLIDQHEPAIPLSILLFFPVTTSVSSDEAAGLLKKSLSEILTLFYPLAGRLNGNQFIDCNDEGVNLFEARVNTQLMEVLEQPMDVELVQLLPEDDFSRVLLSIQINIFDCGGMALGVCLNHKFADASSCLYFINSWATHCRGRGSAEIGIDRPRFGTASLFPPREVEVPPIVTPPYLSHVKLTSKRIIFSASNIAALRAKCSTKSYTPTRVEAVTAYIWSCMMKAAKSDSAALMTGMNLRSRMDPPQPSSLFGNLILGLLVLSKTKDLVTLAAKLRHAISTVDAGYVKKLQTDHRISVLLDSYTEELDQLSLRGGETYSIITSLCRFPLYEADFGWGKPGWVSFVEFGCENLTFLTDTKCGTGIEAWITLSEEQMSRFNAALMD